LVKKQKPDVSADLDALAALSPVAVGAPAPYSASVNIPAAAVAAPTPAVEEVNPPGPATPAPAEEVKKPTAPARGRKSAARKAKETGEAQAGVARLVRVHLTDDEIAQASLFLPISGLIPAGSLTMPTIITALARIGLQEVIKTAKKNIEKGALNG
jgi:hypothetical protein